MVVDKDVVLYHEEKGIVLITLNRPVVLNALNKDLLQQLSYLLDKVRTDNTVRVVIITGAGKKAFSAGADIKFLNQATSYEIRELAQLSVNNKIETLGKVVVAAINGYALGGGLELAEACAFSIADSHAIFGHPEVYIRAIAGWGGTTRLPRLVGKGRATELLLTGNQISAENALADRAC